MIRRNRAAYAAFILALAACGDGGNDGAGGAAMPVNPDPGTGAQTPAEEAPPSEAESPASPPSAGGTDTASNEGTPDDIALTPNEGGEEAAAPGETEAPPVECQTAELPTREQLQANMGLPDPFLGLNGERITSRAQWECRRQEIRRLAERFVYGDMPPAPESVTGTVAADGITVNVQNQGQNVSFSASVTLPPGATGPVPAIIAYGGSNFQNTILQEGVAVINYNVNPVGNQNTPKVGAFYDANPDYRATGNLFAWAWGASRLIDVIEQAGADLIDPARIGVHGCSYAGKGAFIAGAVDERFALTMPFEAGMGGVAAFRLIATENGSEPLRNAVEYQAWAGEVFADFLVLGVTGEGAQAEANQQAGQLQYLLPIDTHEVAGLIAPRGLFVMGNTFVDWLAPRSEYASVVASSQIYAALGVAENFTYHSDTADGMHCAFRQEYVAPLQQNIRKFLLGDAAATTGEMVPGAIVANGFGPALDWETPTLE